MTQKEWLARLKNGVERVSALEKLLLAVVLGSDRKRAIYSIGRFYKGVSEEALSMLYKPASKSEVLVDDLFEF